jgi:hypothetical protein
MVLVSGPESTAVVPPLWGRRGRSRPVGDLEVVGVCPADLRLELVDHLAGHDLQPVGSAVHRDRGLPRLDHHTRDRADLGARPALASTRSKNPLAASCWISPSFGLQMSKPRLHATTRPLTPIKSSTTARARPLTTSTVQRRPAPAPCPQAVGDHAIPEAVDDRGQHPVVVEEHRTPPGQPLGEPAVIGQCIGQIADCRRRRRHCQSIPSS